MSYDICYDRKFLRCENRYIPLVLGGSNNVTEINPFNGRERRSRSWYLGIPQVDKIFIEEDYVNDLKALWQNDTRESGLVFHGKWLTYHDMIAFYENGIKNALSIEEMHDQDKSIVLVSCVIGYHKGEIRTTRELDERLGSTEQVLDWVERAKEKYGEMVKSGEYDAVFFSMQYNTNEPLRLVSPSIANGPVVAKEHRRGRSGGYIQSYTNSSVSFCKDIAQAMVFPDAKTLFASIPNWCEVTVQKANSKPAKQKNVILQVRDTRTGIPVYVLSLRKRTLRYYYNRSSMCKRFTTEKEALKWFEKYIQGRFENRFSDPVAVVEDE